MKIKIAALLFFTLFYGRVFSIPPSVPENDDCVDALMLFQGSHGFASVGVDLTDASKGDFETCSGDQPGLWYKFIAESGTFAVFTYDPSGSCLGSSDTELIISAGSSCGNWDILSDCQDDDNANACNTEGYPNSFCGPDLDCGSNEFFEGTVTPGTTVYIMVKRNGPSDAQLYELRVFGASSNGIPTLSEWGIFILFISFFILGIVVIRQQYFKISF